MIVDKEILEVKNSEQYFYRGETFSGVAVVTDNGIIKEKLLFDDGRVAGCYEPPFSLYATSLLDIDSKCLEGDEEPFSFRGECFSGVAYTFFDGESSVIKQYENGEEVSSAVYSDGDLVSLEHAEADDNFSQSYAWDKAKYISHYSIHSRDEFQFALNFPSKNTISLLTVRGEYFGQIKGKKDLVLIREFETPDFLKLLKADEKLSVTGSGVDDAVFSELFENEGLEAVARLQLYDVSLTKASIEKIITLKNMSELYVESEILNVEDLMVIKSAQPNCHIVFNDKVLTV